MQFASRKFWFDVFRTRVQYDPDRMVVGFTTTYAISANHHQRCEFESRPWRSVTDTTLCDKKFVSGLWQVSGFFQVHRFPPPIKLTATIDIPEILLKVALNTIYQPVYSNSNNTILVFEV